MREYSGDTSTTITPVPLRIYTQHNLHQFRQLQCLSEEQRFAIQVVAQVLPFRVNQYVVDHLLEGPVVHEAVRRIRETGAVIRTQAPVLRRINDDPDVWASMWRKQVHMGMVPYYMFVERNTGARRYFELPFERAWQVYRDAIQQVSGLARTARGPSMSAGPGKVEVQGVTEVGGEKVFVLRFIQARNPAWVQRPFFAKYDPEATWLDQLRPAFGAETFFFEA